MYKRILVPVDGSGTSLKGLNEAIALAQATGAELKLVHIVNEFLDDYAIAPSVNYERIFDSLRDAGQKTLSGANAHAREKGVVTECELNETIGARASNVILEAAKNWHADLIVMGTHGRRGWRRLALGSDAEMVLRSAPVPVLMVRAAEA